MNITANNISLFYEKIGTGEPVLLLHGNGEDHHIFDPLTKKLAEEYTVYAIDSRCHGKSQKEVELSYQAMAQDVACFIQELKLAPVRLVGFSDGAIVGLLLAMQYPTFIKQMALLGINLSPQDFTDENYAYLENLYTKTKDPLIKLMLEEPNISLQQASTVKTPTLLLAGENDLFKPETFANLEKAMPNATLQILSNHQHDTYLVNTDFLFTTLHKFFSKNI